MSIHIKKIQIKKMDFLDLGNERNIAKEIYGHDMAWISYSHKPKMLKNS